MREKSAAGADLQAALDQFVADNRLPAASAAVVCENELSWLGETGLADVAARRPAGPGTLYRIASITKTFTGTAVMRLRDAGGLDLDEPAVAYLPELRSAASPFGLIEAVTIRRMLCHESGLAVDPPGTDWTVPSYQGLPAVALAHASELGVKVAPASQHKYSDLSYQLLGEIVTRVSGVPYPRFLREAVLDPLGMAATGFEPLSDPLLERCASGYDWPVPSGELVPAPGIGPVWAEGGLWSSAEDMARWILFQLGGYGGDPDGDLDGDSGGTVVLDPASLREMHRPRYLADDSWSRAWGISWCGFRKDDHVWIQHGGWLPGFTSILCFDPARRVGAVVLVNGTALGLDICYELAAIARAATPEPRLPGRAVSAAPPAQYLPLLGVYSRPQLGGWVIRLEWQAGDLVFVSPEAPGWKLALLPTADPDVFTVEPGSNFAGEDVVFRRFAGGRVGSVLLVETSYARLDPAVGRPG